MSSSIVYSHEKFRSSSSKIGRVTAKSKLNYLTLVAKNKKDLQALNDIYWIRYIIEIPMTQLGPN